MASKTPMPEGMQEIKELTEDYAEAHNQVRDIVSKINQEVEAIHRQHMPELKSAMTKALQRRSPLYDTIKQKAALFLKPRTRRFANIKVGMNKSKGKVECDDASVIKRIRKLLPENQAELLIRTEEYVHKPAVYDLSAADLKRLGIKIIDDDDVVVIKPMDSEVEKMVKKLLEADLTKAEEVAA